MVWHSAAVGLLTLALCFGGVYEAFSLGSSSGFAALVIGSMPLATSLTAAALGEKQRVNHWFGLVMGFAGVLLVLEDRLGSGLGSATAGFALILGSSVDVELMPQLSARSEAFGDGASGGKADRHGEPAVLRPLPRPAARSRSRAG